jgi:hypothetical protein
LENDTGKFFKIIDDTKLRLIGAIDYEKDKTKSVDVRVTDAAGHESLSFASKLPPLRTISVGVLSLISPSLTIMVCSVFLSVPVPILALTLTV